MRSEKNIQDEIRLHFGKRKDVRLFRNNIGQGFVGKVIKEDREAGIVVLSPYRRVAFGLMPGSGDLIGWKSVVVAGKKIASFLSAETKRPGQKPDLDQENWIDQVRASGGIAGIVTSVDDAKALIDD